MITQPKNSQSTELKMKRLSFMPKKTFINALFLCSALIVLSLFPSRFQGNSRVLQKIKTGYELATLDSNGFFSNVPSADWSRLKERVKNRKNHYSGVEDESALFWYQKNFDPDFTCLHERRVGGMGDGPKWVCDPHRIKSFSEQRKKNGGNGCLIYSVGSFGNFMFEDGMMELLGGRGVQEDEELCEIHIFDPDDYSDVTPPGMNFHNWGLVNNATTGPNYKTLQETILELGHEGHSIDVFKIDCEGCEYETYKDWMNADVTLLQVLVEVHGKPPVPLFETMQENGYVTFHKEANTLSKRGCFEYAMVKLEPSFFK